MNPMARPMFVFDGDDRLIVVAEDEAPYFKAIDVGNGEYIAAFDIDGQLMHLVVGDDDVVVFEATGRYDLQGLVERARRHADRSGYDIDDDDFLLELSRKEQASTWEQRWPRRPTRLSRRVHGEEAPEPYSRD